MGAAIGLYCDYVLECQSLQSRLNVISVSRQGLYNLGFYQARTGGQQMLCNGLRKRLENSLNFLLLE